MKPSTILSLRSMVLFSTTVLSAAVALQYYSPPTTDLRHVASVLYSAVASWLKPPYLYLLINFIIITIAASSKLAATTTDDDDSDDAAPQPVRPLSPEYNYGGAIPADEEDKTAGFSSPGNKENDSSYQAKVRNDHKEPPPATKLRKEYSVEEDAKPPARARFGHRRNVKASPEAVKTTTVLGVTKPRRHETLESTWKAITEGRSIPLNRHLKKSDTWERESRLSQEKTKTPQKTMMSKSETFRDGSKNVSPSSSGGSGSGKIKREPSLGQDELNRRVEAFIKKFNEEMRLQRQESLNQYMDLINR